MKLVIQIPCLNEEALLPTTIADLPKSIDGVDQIELLVIDDGSTDATVAVAQALGVHHIVRHNVNKGLAAAFQTGLNMALACGADVIVNTDADNQYPGHYIAQLIGPILDQQADIVIADRQVDTIPHFSPTKKALQKFGSAVVRYVSKTQVPDATSGFRAFSREAALRINVLTNYTYTLETIIQAGGKNLTVQSIPIETNAKNRESRLIKNIPDYVIRSMLTILWLFVLYQPLKFFLLLSSPFFLGGALLWLRYLVLALQGEAGRGSHIQSIVVGAVLLMIALFLSMMGVLGNLIAVNRNLQEETLYLHKANALTDLRENAAHRNE